MRKKLTSKLIESLPPATGKRYEVRDELLTGLRVRVSSTGGKVWYTSCRIEGKIRRIKIGTYPILSLADAREKARALLRDVQLGRYSEKDPITPTFGEVIPQFIELYAKPRNRSWKSTERVLVKFAKLNDRPINEITRGHVVLVLDRLTAAGATIGANRALAAVKKLFAWCVDRGAIDINPVAGFKAPAKEVSRDRVLTDDEIRAYWTAYRYTDEFAAYVGLALRTVREISSKDQLAEIECRLVGPASTLLDSLQDSDFFKEFLAPWSGLKRVDTESFIDQLKTVVAGAHEHIATIKAHSGKGRSPDGDFKHHFVTMVAIFCECIDPDFEPTRKVQFKKAEPTQFSEAVYLLAKPLFPTGEKRPRLTFEGAIRKHVDMWNANKKAFLETRKK